MISLETIQSNQFATPALGAGMLQDELPTQNATLDLKKLITIATAAKIDGKGIWGNQEFTREGIIELLLDHKIGPKEGKCLVQGELIGKDKHNTSMLENHILVLDFDKGDTLQELTSRMAKTGYAFVIHSTHSHLNNATAVLRKDILNYFPDREASHTFSAVEVQKYLSEYKKVKPELLQELEIIEQAKPSIKGPLLIAKHSPIEKCRMAFFLNKPFEFQGLFDSQDRIREWSDRYRGFGQAHNLPFDESCKDVARGFFLPRHKKDSPFVAEFYDGRAVCLEDFPRVPIANAVDRRTSKQTTVKANLHNDSAKANALSFDPVVGNLNLLHWVQAYDFRITSALMEAEYECRIQPQGGKATFPCPFENEHSATEGQDNGFFAVDFDGEANTGNGFHMQCMHSHGPSNDRLTLLKGLIENGDFPIEYLTDERFAVPKMTAESAAEKVRQLDPKDTNAALALAKALAFAPIDSALKDAHFTAIAKRTGLTKKSMQALVPKSSMEGVSALLKRQEEYNERYAMVRLGSSVVVLDLGKNGPELDYLNVRAFQDFKANDKVKVGDSLVPVAERWLEWEARQTFERIEFEPSNPTAGNFNLFKGFNRVESDQTKDWSLIKLHLLEVLCSGNIDYFNWLMTWFANIIQRPGEKLGSAIVVQGTKGSGKSIIFDAFADLLQPYTYKTAESEQIIGKFNWHLSNKLLLIAEEAIFAGDTKADSALKNLITSKEIGFEKKGHDSIMLNNYLRLVVISNEDWIIRASRDHERRYLVLQTIDTYIGDLGYFGKILKQIDSGGLSGFRYALENWVPPYEESWNVLRSPPKTEWLEEQADLATTPWDSFFYEAIENGFFENGYKPIDLSEDKPTLVKVSELFEAYSEALGSAPFARNKATPQTLASLIKKHLKAVKDKRKDGTYYIIPSLSDIRSKKKIIPRAMVTTEPEKSSSETLKILH
jgi:hypothetical protein